MEPYRVHNYPGPDLPGAAGRHTLSRPLWFRALMWPLRLLASMARSMALFVLVTGLPFVVLMPVLPHEALDAMQTAGQALGQHVMPDAASTIGSVAALEAAIDRRHQHLVVPRASAGAAVEPGMEPRAGDIQRVAQPCHRPDVPVPRDESEPHIASLAK